MDDPFIARSAAPSQIRADGSGTYWVEEHPSQGGRGALLRHRDTGEMDEVLPLIDGSRLSDVGTRIHEYSGKAYAVHHGVAVFSDQTNGRVYALNTANLHHVVCPLTTLLKVRYGDFWIASVRDLVYVVAEDHSVPGEPASKIIAIPLDESVARNDGAIITMFEGADFTQAPMVSLDDTKVA